MRVFLTDLHFSPDIAARLTASLPREQGHRAGNLAATVGFHLVRYALHQIAPEADADHWITGAQGKPQLPTGVPHFNLSHSRLVVAVAVSNEHEVGIDIEEVKARPFKFVQRYYTDQELTAVEHATNRTSEIIRIWTAKEAKAKERGAGIDENFRNIPTNGVQNTLVLVGERPHWLAVTPANRIPRIQWVAAEQLLFDI